MEILITIVMITLLILVHELGHYLFAKYYGFMTPVFGIGMPFGPFIEIFEKWGTKFRFYFALIGGFVAIPELGDETDPELLKELGIEDKSMKEFAVYKRILVASGGILFNIFFALFLAIVMAASFGLPKAVPNNEIKEFVAEDVIAFKAGLQIDDRVVRINTEEISTSEDLKNALAKFEGQVISLDVKRAIEGSKDESEILNFEFFNEGKLGVVLGQDKIYEKSGANPLKWIWDGVGFTANTLSIMVISVINIIYAFLLKVMNFISPNFVDQSTDLNQVKGIIGIVELISKDIAKNYYLIFEFAVLLSLNLAVINLLPIPGLDGGHIMFMIYEGLIGKKLPEKFSQYAMQFGFLFLMSIIVLTTFNDIKNWVAG